MQKVNEASAASNLARPSSRPPPAVPFPLQRAERLGPYRLCFEIASGGMATLYLARVDLLAGIHRFVALKRIHPHLMKDTVFVEMFLDEARIASQINHANVCSVFDFGVADGAYYIAMEYLAGEPLSTVRRTLLRRADPLEPEKLAALAARIIADAAEGIHAAHELRDPSGVPLDVVHRDVSPDNVFLTYDGVVKIVDFGVARASRQKHRTRTGVLKGKYAYIQPETLRGSRPDRRADVWGLGVILWELLTLKRLFHRRMEIDTLKAVLDERIAAPSELHPGIPEELDAIAAKALARDPAERYQTARELGRDLTRFLAQRQTAVGLAELSEFMAELFPGAAARKRQLIGIAEHVDARASALDAEVSAHSAPSEDDELSSCRTRVRNAPSLPRNRARMRTGLVGLGLLLALVAAAGFFSTRSLHEANASSARALPTPMLPPAPPAPAVALEKPESPTPRSEPANDDRAIPIRLGQGPIVLEIAPNEGADRGDGVTLRIRNDRRSHARPPATAPARVQRMPTEPSVPQPLALEGESP